MFDPFSLLAGAGILAVGFLTGRFGRKRTSTTPPPVCGCKHGLDQHDPQTKTCHGEIKRGSSFEGDVHYVPCACRQYVGPKPLEEMFAQQYLPPTD